MTEKEVCIIGAGPAGATSALFLHKNGISCTLIDKESFPRNKTCGEGIRSYALTILEEVCSNISDQLEKEKIITPIHTAFFSNEKNQISLKHNSCFGTLRYQWDEILIKNVRNCKNIDLKTNTYPQKIKKEGDYTYVYLENEIIKCRTLFIATGSNSALTKQFVTSSTTVDNTEVAYVAHYDNVNFQKGEGTQEAFFLEELHGGYFYIMPLPNGKANVGIVLHKSKIEKHQLQIKSIFKKLIESHPQTSSYFKHAHLIDKPKGISINIDFDKKSFSGDGYLLLGDAILPTHPITGFGVAHAMLMGKIAAIHIKKCIEKKDFSTTMHLNYDRVIQQKIGPEILYGKFWDFMIKKPFYLKTFLKITQVLNLTNLLFIFGTKFEKIKSR